MSTTFPSYLSPEGLARLLQRTPRREQPNAKLKHSAVMMLLLDREWNGARATHLVFIMKTRDGSRHAGQVAFPGGKVDPEDGSALAAALRETHEEIGIAPPQLEVLGSLGYFSTMTTGFDAAVFLARACAPLKYSPQKSEVAAIFEIPFALFAQQYDPGLQLVTPSDVLKLHYHVAAAPFFCFKGEDWPATREHICIWGFTARVLQHFILLLRENDDGREDS
jgi:8-oxo-dGTP pyrophosphatase MutT (NUDIX family)